MTSPKKKDNVKSMELVRIKGALKPRTALELPGQVHFLRGGAVKPCITVHSERSGCEPWEDC